jgi:4'-phosphopantetheinyl transferase EntD
MDHSKPDQWPETEAPAIAGALKGLLGPGFALACERPRSVDGLLFEEERSYLAQAGAKRRAEFGTARLCARRALLELGIPSGPLVPQADRSPTWPNGVVGSISHSSGWCVAAVTTRPDVAGVGVDIEDDTPLEPDLELLVCTPMERRILAGLGDDMRGRSAKILFSAKEAIYKCQYPTIGIPLDFHDLELDLDSARGEVRLSRVACDEAVRAGLMTIELRFVRLAGLILTAALLPG